MLKILKQKRWFSITDKEILVENILFILDQIDDNKSIFIDRHWEARYKEKRRTLRQEIAKFENNGPTLIYLIKQQ